MSETIRVLMIGDVVGKSGCVAVFTRLKTLKKRMNADLCVLNGENATEGHGITPDVLNMFYQSGADIITSGNHIWQKKEIYPFLNSDKRLLRPENYPAGVDGKGVTQVTVGDKTVAVLNLQGLCELPNIRSPFAVGKEVVQRLRNKCNIIIIDFHAESTAEKEALGIYLDGQVSVVAGTHTHIQTADERILPNGTAYISDIGMTGARDSVLGMDPAIIIKKNLTQMPLKMETSHNNADIMGILCVIDANSGKSLSIERVVDRSF
ncbi:MAG: TIGR00282 family metallophosphoesterase [Spirochaetales bacterium]|nr:TIGR00282 family metallophosphoesterase [Spirochaetales bacterium]